ncbi:ARM repeat-containing protein [Thelephora ganbajun]|uniref:ARM repeat-containing protein n=1 Tax=Thelephora ganbajun TaxID=370292 RepID=A0ACB6ZVG9_THEGA|nr:ARM repeat-containing protein [Thelephora ganbajun]
MSQQQTAKPSLQGVRIKARKGTVKAQAKHEPTVFRDQLYKHFETIPPGDFEAFTNKLIQAGSTLEFLKYADALFEILFVGGLLQPGGSYIDDGSPICPWAIVNANDPASAEELKKYIDVQNKLIRRYKYLQKPLEESALPTLLQYINRWPPAQKDKIAIAIGIMLSQSLTTAGCLQSLTKDHLIKNDVAADVIAIVFRTYIAEQSIDHLASTLKKGGIKDLLLFFPQNKREDKVLDEFFRKQGLAQVADWWTKKKYAILKEEVIKTIREHIEHGDSNPDIVSAIQVRQEEQPLPETELVQCIWTGLISSIEWSARPDQHEGLIIKEVAKFAEILEPFCHNPKTEVTLINTVQVYCYEDTRVVKSFPQIVKTLYNKDCVSDQAIIYWYQKGAKTHGKQHFLKAAEPLVKFLQEQEEDESEGE